MKNWLMMTILLLSNVHGAQAAQGCLDDSYHVLKEKFYTNLDPSVQATQQVYRDPRDYPLDSKVWHPVYCSCPCDRYRGWYLKNKTEATGYCVVCQHRGKPDRQAIQNKESEQTEIEKQFSLLKTIISSGK